MNNNFSQLMKQAQQMQAKLMAAQNKVAEMELTGSAGSGMVTIIITGKGDIKKLTIDPKLMVPEDADMVSDLVIAAYNEAKKKLEDTMAENMGGILPPGMKLPF